MAKTATPVKDKQISGAAFTSDGKYIYCLHRIWDDEKPTAICIGLNPSTATSNKDDQTITWVTNSLKSLGYGGFFMCNLFALISSNPEDLRSCPDPVGDNDEYIESVIKERRPNVVIYCWGNFKQANYRVKQLLKWIPKGKCFGKNKNGSPWHPLAMMYAGIKPSEATLIDF
jgi:hypothetical protein